MADEMTVSAKPWYASKVVWFNALSTALFFLASDEIQRLVPNGGTEAYMSLVGLVNLGLRFLTSGPVTGNARKAIEINRLIAPMVIVVMAMTGLGACSMRGKPVQRVIATYGIQVNDGLRSVGETAKQLHGSKVITNEQYRDFLKGLDAAFVQSSRLADALAAYDLAAGPTTASQVKAALDSLAVLVPAIGTGLGGGPGVQKIVELVGNVNKLLLTISSGLAPSARLSPDKFHGLVKFNEALEAN
jgi:hypothetical protein